MATTKPLTWTQLVAIARRVGVEVVEAPSSHRGKKGTMGSIAGITLHHTGTANTYKSTDDYPDYNVVKEGRTGLVNSLSAFGLGRHRAIYVFSEYLSWHAGTWNWKGVTDGNGHFLGIEAAGVGDWTEFQRKVYPRLVAAILLEIGAGIDMAPRHLDGAMPRGRKTDAANFTGNFYQGKTFYQWVEYFLANPAYININYTGTSAKPSIEEDDTVYVSIEPGETKVIPLPAGNKVVTLAVDEDGGGRNVRVAAFWGRGKVTSVPNFQAGEDKFTGYVFNGDPAAIPLGELINTITISYPEGSRYALGVSVERAG